MARKQRLSQREFLHIYCLDNPAVHFDRDTNKLYFNGVEVTIYNTPGKYATANITGIIRIGVHRIIACLKYGEAYLQPRIEARHLNGNPNDYSWDNIAIGTHKENMHDIPQELWDRIHAAGVPVWTASGVAATKARWDAMEPEERSDVVRTMALKRESAMSKEQKSERSKKGWLKKSRDVVIPNLKEGWKQRHIRRASDPNAQFGSKKSGMLTLEQVVEIMKLHATGEYSNKDLIAMYKIHPSLLWTITHKLGCYAYIAQIHLNGCNA